MAAAVDHELPPSLEAVRELAPRAQAPGGARSAAMPSWLVPLRHTFIADCETPVSAYLKLRGDGPSFLLESAEQGQQVGRGSFLGFRPRAVIRLNRGEHSDPYRLLDEELARYRIAPLEGLPPFAGGAVGMFGYDLARSAEPTIGEPNPDDTGMPELAVMVTDVLVAFDHLRHEVTVLANVVMKGEHSGAGSAPPRTAVISSRPTSRPRLRSRTCASACADRCRRQAPGGASRPSSPRTWAPTATRRRSSGPRSTSAPATSTRWCRASAGARTAPWTRSRSTAACARSTRARTCTSSTSRTSRSRARPRR